MLIVQYIWSMWDKRFRGTHRGTSPRVRHPPAYALVLPTQEEHNEQNWLHEVTLSNNVISERAGYLAGWSAGGVGVPRRHGVANLRWSLVDGVAELAMEASNSGYPPALRGLPHPFYRLQPGEMLLVDYNARLNPWPHEHGTAFLEHRFWIALTETPKRDMFLGVTPKKHIDLRQNIY